MSSGSGDGQSEALVSDDQIDTNCDLLNMAYPEMLFVSPIYSHTLLRGGIVAAGISRNIEENLLAAGPLPRFVFLPVYDRNLIHWSLLVLDFRTQIALSLDSAQLRGTLAISRRVLSVSRLTTNNRFTIREPLAQPLQSDDESCGHYVIHNMHVVATHIHIHQALPEFVFSEPKLPSARGKVIKSSCIASGSGL